MTVVFDSSAVLALLFNEPGRERVKAAMPEAVISAVNFGEVVSKLLERGLDPEVLDDVLSGIRAEIVDFDAELARASGLLRLTTQRWGLSLGDRCCLALAAQLNVTVLTTDRTWANLDLSIPVELIR